MKEKGKILITGAGGFTGSHACEFFYNAGYDVIAAGRGNVSDPWRVKYYRCELTDSQEVDRMIGTIQPQFVLHLAGFNDASLSWMNPTIALEANVISTLYLVDALRRINPDCKIIVAGSALEFNPNSKDSLTSPYSLSKTMQTMIAQSWMKLYNMNIIIVRPSNLIGPGISNGICTKMAKVIVELEKANKSGKMDDLNINATRDFLDVRDAVSAYEILLRKGQNGEVYDISSGKVHCLLDIASIYQSLSSIPFEIVPQENPKLDHSLAKPPEKIMGLGWKPKIHIRKSLTDILEYQRERHKDI
ncbi:NAD-dependent epimerase/dehydratase family protein [Cytobacillus purgationiresistens]|uniref:GDP-4-dehydro-6-deoxy-D-mannose reductase n=1 Tax=Cytobacillus purgationiresistens TaxID=863449 RepID=A0ABU0AEP4_9BACI|nr:NAD-dependent epimerase/dehydratase family protein [Cytobacillus purgationiresistens]MDQ0269724.1 GDP-4-dehydro-6-deoxy-D-mannose reductase [Cytobacillus purgationiresistens]